MTVSASARSRILLVEDEALILCDIEELLNDAGFDVVGVRNAEEAIKILEDDVLSIVALISDINLVPGSRSGWDIAVRARELSATIPVVYVTADSAKDWPSRGVPDSVLIPKPFAGAQIVTAVAQLLNVA